MTAVDGQQDAAGDYSSAGSDTTGRSDEWSPKQSSGWKFVVSWIAFAVTLLLTVALGVQVVLGTKGLG